jgi:antirestriction protein ArdC
MAKKSVHEIVTDRILEALEAGTVPWRRPWRDAGAPVNLVSAKAYRGINPWLLELTAAAAGYDSPVWATFNQWKAAGGSVRKGEKGTLITFWKTLERKNAAGELEPGRVPLLRYYYVFNLAQIDGEPKIPAKTRALLEAAGEPMPFEPSDVADAIVRGMPRRPAIGSSSSAWYSPDRDTVGMPARESFESPAHYYATLFHELTHSTAHESRVGRPIDSFSASAESYAREELIAEIGAALMLAYAGIDSSEVFENSVAYIAGWRRALTNDPRLIVSAAAAAQKAADYIRRAGELELEGKEDSSSSSSRAGELEAAWYAGAGENVPAQYVRPRA